MTYTVGDVSDTGSGGRCLRLNTECLVTKTLEISLFFFLSWCLIINEVKGWMDGETDS